MLTILTTPNPLLLQKSAAVTFPLSPAHKKLVLDLFEYVQKDKGSAGLAAPQTGSLFQIIVVTDKDRRPRIMINPQIVFASPKHTQMEEGCLSIPQKLYTIERAFAIKVAYQNLKGRKMIESLQGWEARIVQHEIDHLNGILIDRLGPEFTPESVEKPL